MKYLWIKDSSDLYFEGTLKPLDSLPSWGSWAFSLQMCLLTPSGGDMDMTFMIPWNTFVPLLRKIPKVFLSPARGLSQDQWLQSQQICVMKPVHFWIVGAGFFFSFLFIFFFLFPILLSSSQSQVLISTRTLNIVPLCSTAFNFPP